MKDVKYVLITVHMKDSTTLNTEGYLVEFKSLVEKDMEVVKTDDTFIWLYRKGSIHIYSTKYYYVSQIIIGMGDKGMISSTEPFEDTVESQTEAFNKVKEVIKVMVDEGFIRYNGLVDYEKYSDIPKGKREDIDLFTSGNAKSGTPISYSRNTSQGSNNSLYGTNKTYDTYPYRHNHSTYVPKVVSTAILVRNTTYDVAEAMAEMSKKIKSLQEKKYIPPELPKIPLGGEKEEMNVDKSKNALVSMPFADDDYNEQICT